MLLHGSVLNWACTTNDRYVFCGIEAIQDGGMKTANVLVVVVRGDGPREVVPLIVKPVTIADPAEIETFMGQSSNWVMR